MFNKLTLSLLLLAAFQAQAGACTREYKPVCGQLPDTTQTFANRCVMTNAGAVLLSDGDCKPKPVTKDIRLKVAPKLEDCIGIVPMRCMRVKMDDQENWSAHYENIEGFSFVPGFEYTLLVRITWIDKPLADASNVRYTLLRELSRVPTE